MKKRFLTISLFLLVLFFSLQTFAFSVPGEKISYLHKRSFLFNIGLNTADIINNQGLDGNFGIGFRVGVTHPLNDYLAVDLQYQLTTIWLHSPDPVQQGQRVKSNFLFNQGYSRLIASWPKSWWQPYIFAGVGIYNFVGVDGKTGLSFPLNLEVPMGAGLNLYLYSNRIYLRTEFAYHLLFAEGQSQAVLDLLGVPKVKFDVYSVNLGLVFAFY